MREMRMGMEVIGCQCVAGDGGDRVLPQRDRVADDLCAGVAMLPRLPDGWVGASQPEVLEISKHQHGHPLRQHSGQCRQVGKPGEVDGRCP